MRILFFRALILVRCKYTRRIPRMLRLYFGWDARYDGKHVRIHDADEMRPGEARRGAPHKNANLNTYARKK